MATLVDLSFEFPEWESERGISVLRKYLDILETQMGLVHSEEIKALNKLRNDPNVDGETWFDKTEYLENLFDRDLIPTMRYSFVVFVHTFAETRLREICSHIQRKKQIALSMKELSGSQFDKVRTYLSKVCGINVADLPEWRELRRIQSIRDRIVHHYGYLPYGRDEAKEIYEMEREKLLYVSEENRIELGFKFCQRHLGIVEKLLQTLHGAEREATKVAEKQKSPASKSPTKASKKR